MLDTYLSGMPLDREVMDHTHDHDMREQQHMQLNCLVAFHLSYVLQRMLERALEGSVFGCKVLLQFIAYGSSEPSERGGRKVVINVTVRNGEKSADRF